MSAAPPEKRDVFISKSLSYLLRHGAIKEKLPIDELGYVKLDTILAHPRVKTHKATVADIERIVKNNDKQRFSLKAQNGDTYICANQGHSLPHVSNENLELLETMPTQVYHGTYKHKIAKIMERGLSRMGRNHIHFTSNAEWSRLGIRKNCNVLIFLDTEKCQAAGFTFYRSENGVILCGGDADGYIGSEFFQSVQDA